MVPMKLKIILMALSVIALSAVAGIYGVNFAAKQDHVQRLLETRECRGCNLEGANLDRMNLEGVNLEDANLEGASLRGAKLGKANLERANLRRANLEQADLGCTAFSFSLRANETASNLDFNVDENPEASNPQNFPYGFNISTDDDSATFSVNLGGCANLRGSSLQGATMPNGSIHP
jgi:uncharacterized protein YjbI with pentapeptide repeats